MKGLALPSLVVQGDRDALADLELLRPRVAELSGAELHIVRGGDHGFAVLKRSGRDPEDVFEEICETVSSWIGHHAAADPAKPSKGDG